MEHLPPFNLVDVVVLAYMVLGVAVGIYRGLSGELARLISVVPAFGISVFLYRPIGVWMLAHTRLAEPAARALSFLAVIAAAFVIMLLLRFVLKRAMSLAFEGATDKIGGAIAGFLSSAIVAAIVFVAVSLWPHAYLNRQFGKESVIGRIVLKYTPALREKVEDLQLPERVRDTVEKSDEDIAHQAKEERREAKRNAGGNGQKPQDRIRAWFK